MNHPVTGFEHLHRHTDYSLLDGFARVDEYADRMREINQKFLCVTDHGVMGSIPQQIAVCETVNGKPASADQILYPVFGCELYVNSMQPKVGSRNESVEFRKHLGDEQLQKKFDKSCHLLAIAHNLEGYRNLIRLTSWGWMHGYYRRPRVNHDVLDQYKDGILFTSTCGNSEIAQAFFQGGDDSGFAMLEKYMAMFGDKFWLELMMLDWKQQKPYDAFLLRAHDKYGVPIFLSQDCHVCKKEHSHNQHLMLLQKSKRTLADIEAMRASGDDDIFELQDSNLWLKSEDELNEFWEAKFFDTIDYELFKIAKSNSVKIAQFAKGVELDREIKLPQIPDAEAKLWDEVKRGFVARRCPRDDARYVKRVREEYELIVEKGFCSYFLIQKMMVDEARDYCQKHLGFAGEYAVGPGRGSIGGSLLAYCLRLHDVDPIRHDLRFSRFLSPARGGKQTKFQHTIEPVPLSSLVA